MTPPDHRTGKTTTSHVDQFVRALRDLSDALDGEGVDWAVGGAVAANKYRDQTRTTSDLDVLLVLAERDIRSVEKALRRRGWRTRSVVGDYLLRMSHPVAGQLDAMASGTVYERGAVARAHRVRYDEVLSFKTLAIEDVVLLKLVANRARDDMDIQSILVARPEFDHAYMEKWLDEFEHVDLRGRLERNEAVVRESGLRRDDSPGR